ncbi:DUF302 domain-containing protein [Sulfurovum sp. ST-21]|uniref:DUF302 domain-containing protein n=1 Tax=Sulfurovum indicum TaxID=2779528 RepID=A0A7M1S3V0_9BACT|nr:DUF302 domain-containing protein [Sulfurovum indicum]QOR62103.1 DUF302 domain-containing protein [Sulfurovum indicum]
MKYSNILGSVAFSALLLMGTTGCNSENDILAAEETVSPYQRVAVIPGTWDDVNAIATKIAQMTIYSDENQTLGYPTNWVIAGANLAGGETDDGLDDLLPIPAIGGKSRVIEFCNKAYATAAIETGRFHGSALPCEVSVHSDGTNVYVDMLDAEAIFNIFFTDAKDNFTDAENAEFAKLASAVKSELRGMVKAALEDDNGASGSAAVDYTESTLAMGPVFTQEKIDNEISLRNPYIVYKYTGTGTGEGGSFTLDDADTLAREIIAKLGTDTATADTNVPGVSQDSAWRSGRPDPISIPNVKVVEACSPKYAAKATALGNEYITALPCEITVYVDETDPTGQTLAISFLNPNFMFGTMFEGAVEKAYMEGTLSKADMIEYSTLADVVFADLRLIVDAAVQGSVLGLAVPQSL